MVTCGVISILRKIKANIGPACDFSNGHTKSYYFTKGVCDSQRHTFGRKPSHFKWWPFYWAKHLGWQPIHKFVWKNQKNLCATDIVIFGNAHCCKCRSKYAVKKYLPILILTFCTIFNLEMVFFVPVGDR